MPVCVVLAAALVMVVLFGLMCSGVEAKMIGLSSPVDMTKFTFERYSAVFNCSLITTQAIRIFNFWLVHIVSI